jgi:hypothetical protein
MKDISEDRSYSFIKRDQVSQFRNVQKLSKERNFNKSIFNVSFIRPDNNESEKVIWGTTLNIDVLKKQFTNFIKNFHPANNMLIE